MGYRDRNNQPDTLKELKRKVKLAEVAAKINQQRDSNASLTLRENELRKRGKKGPMQAAYPERNRRSSIADIDAANTRLALLEKQFAPRQQPQQAAPVARQQAPAAAIQAAPAPTFERNTEMTEQQAAMAAQLQRDLREQNPNITEQESDAKIKAAMTEHARVTANPAPATSAAQPSTDPLLDIMKQQHGPTTRREGDFFRTDVQSESGPRSIDVSPTFAQSKTAQNPNWSSLTPSQRAANIMSSPRAAVPNPGTMLTPEKQTLFDENHNVMGRGRYGKTGEYYGEDVKGRPLMPKGATAQPVAGAIGGRGLVTPDGSLAFARPALPAAPQQGPPDIPQWQKDVLKTNPMIGVAGSQSNKDFVGSYKAAGGAANDFNPGVLESMASSAGTNLTGPGSSSGVANRLGNTLVNPPGVSNKPGAIPATGTAGQEGWLGMPTIQAPGTVATAPEGSATGRAGAMPQMASSVLDVLKKSGRRGF